MMVSLFRPISLVLLFSVGMGSLGIAESESTEPDTFNRLVGVDLFGDDLTPLGIKGISLAECEAVCSNDSSCTAYSFIKAKQWCFPKHGSGNKQDNSTVISGIKKLAVILNEQTAPTQVNLQVELMQGIPEQNRDAAQRIINDYSKQCSGSQDVGENRKLKIEQDNLKQIKLLQGDTELTVLTASFECPGVGHIWSGTSGSPTYLIIGGVIYEMERGSPIPFNVSGLTVLVNWHGGIYCSALNGETYSNMEPCFSSLLWNNHTKTFVIYDGPLKVIKRHF